MEVIQMAGQNKKDQQKGTTSEQSWNWCIVYTLMTFIIMMLSVFISKQNKRQT